MTESEKKNVLKAQIENFGGVSEETPGKDLNGSGETEGFATIDRLVEEIKAKADELKEEIHKRTNTEV